MAFISLDFLNKNMYRKYPFRSTSSHTFTNGVELPQALITAIQISTIFSYRKIYISRIYAKNDYLSVLIREVDSNIVLGSFNGVVTSSNQVLNLVPSVTQISGSLTIGNPTAVSLVNGVGLLSAVDGRLEDSTIFCFSTPAVVAITNESNTATGHITLTTDNIKLTQDGQTIDFAVKESAKIASKNDFSGEFGNCGTPLIKLINTVRPDGAGNIDIYGIEPISIVIGSGNIGLTTPSLALIDVCPEKQKALAPTDVTDVYYTTIETATDPEWKTWPEYS